MMMRGTSSNTGSNSMSIDSDASSMLGSTGASAAAAPAAAASPAAACATTEAAPGVQRCETTMFVEIKVYTKLPLMHVRRHTRHQ